MAEIRQLHGYAALADLPCWELVVGDSRVIVSSYGAHVLSYQVGTKQLLWLSDTAIWQNAKAIRGGIPICWPWFGACPAELNLDQTAKPNHGLARTQVWQVLNQLVTDHSVSIVFSLNHVELPWTNELITLEYLVELTEDALAVTLRCDQTITQQAALHSYFRVDNCSEAQVAPLPAQFYDKTTDKVTSSNDDSCSFITEVDRVYANTEEMLNLTSTNLQLEIKQFGHDASIIWNPGFAKASQAADIAPNSWQQFVCVESAALNLSPARLNLSQQIQNPFRQHR